MTPPRHEAYDFRDVQNNIPTVVIYLFIFLEDLGFQKITFNKINSNTQKYLYLKIKLKVVLKNLSSH